MSSQFNLKKFDNAKLEPRTESVAVPELAEYFDGDGDPIWTVRGLDGQEVYHVRSAFDRDRMIARVVERFAGTTKDKLDGIEELFGIGNEVNEEASKRIELLLLGSVSPKLDRPAAVKLLKSFPTTAGQLTDTILKLTGFGFVPGKRPGSGGNHASETP